VAEVFINYRTGDGDEAAELLAARLSDRFGPGRVFKASRSIQPGELFPKVLIDAAKTSAVLLAVMGPGWGAALQLREEADWVRTEILAAQASGTRVVPVLKGRRTEQLDRASLPPELRWLADVQSLRLDMHESTGDLTRIGDFLADVVPALKAADRTACEPAAAGATDNAASDVAGDLVQGRDIFGGVHNYSVTNTGGQRIVGNRNNQTNITGNPGTVVINPKRTALDTLRDQLSDDDPEKRIEAAEELSRGRYPEAVHDMDRQLRKEDHMEARYWLIEALGNAGGADAIQILTAFAQTPAGRNPLMESKIRKALETARRGGLGYAPAGRQGEVR
jgi:hypothetical protein